MLREEVIKLLKKYGIETNVESLEVPPREEFGDLAFSCFKIASEKKEDPKVIAKELAQKIEIPEDSLVEKVEAKGGYLNFFFKWEKVAEYTLKKIIENEPPFTFEKSEKVAVVEYSSPNPAHPIHIGSARTTFIGESLARILEYAGWDVKRMCYINDLGKQIAVLIWGYLKFAKGKKPDKKPDYWLLDIYVKANEMLEKNPEFENEVKEILRRCEKRGEEIIEVWSKLIDWCIEGFKQTYEKIGIRFDEFLKESSFIEISKEYVKKLLEKKFAFKTEDGAVVVDLEKFNLPSTVLLRKDGTGLYLTRDIAASIYKFEKYKPELNIYVVGEDQKLHFKQQFKILELLGFENFVKNSFHVSFGYINLPEGKMSSRKGRVVLIDDVFEEASKRVKESYSVDEEKAMKIGVGAITYAILKIDPNKQVTFRWEEILNLKGNSGPYLQYAHARCCSILRKAGDWEVNYKVSKVNELEKAIIKTLLKFPKVVLSSTKDLKPNYVCNYAYELATVFDKFYEHCPVLKAENDELKNFRLTLVKVVKEILAITLGLVLVHPLEKM